MTEVELSSQSELEGPAGTLEVVVDWEGIRGVEEPETTGTELEVTEPEPTGVDVGPAGLEPAGVEVCETRGVEDPEPTGVEV